MEITVPNEPLITHESKIGDLTKIKQRVKELQEQGKKVVYVEGVFDIIHLGHIEFIEFAKTQGDALVVGVASDEYAATKGEGKPVFNIGQRTKVLAALADADLILKLENPPASLGNQEADDYLMEVTTKLVPDVIVASIKTDTNPIAKKVQAEAIGVKFVPYESERPTPHSSSSIIREALERLS